MSMLGELTSPLLPSAYTFGESCEECFSSVDVHTHAGTGNFTAVALVSHVNSALVV